MTKGQTTQEEKDTALAEFKSKANLLERDKNDDASCCRFLKARQYNVDKAVEMYNAYAIWRAENNVDTVLDSPFGVDKNLWKHSFHGRDKEGRPLFIEPTGALDIKAIIGKGYEMDTLVRAHIYQQEYIAKLTEEATKKEGQPIEQMLSILDLEGAGVWCHLNGTAREFFSILAGLAQNYYPERLYKLIVVNAPRAFPMAWNFIKPFLDINTQNKIIIPHYKDQLKVLEELVDPCFIPEKFGGQCKCEQKGCFTNANPSVISDALRYDEGNTQTVDGEGKKETNKEEKEDKNDKKDKKDKKQKKEKKDKKEKKQKKDKKGSESKEDGVNEVEEKLKETTV